MAKWSRRKILTSVLLGSGAIVATGAGLLTRGTGGNIALPGRSRARTVRTEMTPPESAEVVIIGGGVVGVCTAYNLAAQGVAVALCEKGTIAGEASGRAFGNVGISGLDPFKFELIELSKRQWSTIDTALGGKTGYRRCGYVATISAPEQRDFWASWIESAGPFGSQAKLLNTQEANAIVPARTSWLGAFQQPTDGCAEPILATSAIAEAAQRLGARVIAPCAVRGFETSAGRVSHVVTERGAIRTSAAVLAGGCWSTLFAERARIRLPSLNVFSSLVRVTGAEAPFSMASIPGLDARKQVDGTWSLGATSGHIPITPALLKHLWDFRKVIANPPWDVHINLSDYFWHELRSNSAWKLDEVSPFESNRVLEPQVNTVLTDSLLSSARSELKGFANAQLVERWSGALNVTPDNVPVISAVETVPGLYLGTGFSYGVTMGPAAGLLLAELVMTKRPSVDLTPYRHSRYTDGSALQLTH